MYKNLFTMFYREIHVEKLNEPYYLIPMGDWHYDSPLCDRDRLHETLEWMKKKPRCMGFGMGDLWDFTAYKEGRTLSSVGLHEQTREVIEQQGHRNVETMYSKIKGIDWLGFLLGNHDFHFADGTSTTTRLCARLGVPFLGVLTLFRLSFRHTERNCQTIDIYAHHGKGASRLMGGSINRVYQMAESMQADIFLMGHDHKGAVAPEPILVPQFRNGRMSLKQRKRYFLRTGSFLKGLESGEGSYVAGAAGKQTHIGCPKIELTPKKGGGNFHVDVHVSI